jgi:hypothetical protein
VRTASDAKASDKKRIDAAFAEADAQAASRLETAESVAETSRMVEGLLEQVAGISSEKVRNLAHELAAILVAPMQRMNDRFADLEQQMASLNQSASAPQTWFIQQQSATTWSLKGPTASKRIRGSRSQARLEARRMARAAGATSITIRERPSKVPGGKQPGKGQRGSENPARAKRSA